VSKIIIIKNHFSTLGGLEKYARVILETLLKKNHKITLLTSHKKPKLTHPNLDVHNFKISSPIEFIKLKKFSYLSDLFVKKITSSDSAWT
jgi:hypothetical protein